MSAHSYILDNRVLSLYKGEQVCYKCGDPIEVGERIVTRRGGAGRRIMYHKQCAADLNIVVSIKSKELRRSPK